MVHHFSIPGYYSPGNEVQMKCQMLKLLQNKPSDKQQTSLQTFNQEWIPQLRYSSDDVRILSSPQTTLKKIIHPSLIFKISCDQNILDDST